LKLSLGGLATRLLILFLLLALVPVSGVGLLSYNWGRHRIRARVENHLESVAILKEQEIDQWVEHLEHTMTWLANDPHTSDWVPTLITSAPSEADYTLAYDAMAGELRRVAALGHMSLLLLLDAQDGRILVASDPSWEGQFRDMEPWFTQGRAGTWTQSLHYSQRLERATMLVAAPVSDKEGETLAVLAGHANLDNLQAVMLERSGLGDTGETYLVNAGNLLLTELRFDPEATFRRWVFTEGVDRALGGESGVDVYDDYREEPVIGSYRWLEGMQAALLVEMDQAEAFAPIVTLRRSITAVSVAVAVAAALLGLVISRGLTKPLNVMVQGTQAIGAGKLEHRISVGVGGEIGQLAEAFNRMTEQVQRARRRTEDALALNQRIINTTSVGITAYGASGQCVLANEAAAHIVGASHDQVLDQNFYRIRSWQTSGLLDAAREALRSGEIQRQEVAVSSSFGRRAWLDCRFAPFTLEGEPHLLVLTDDVTERKRMEEQLVRQERLATLGQLSGSIAHELRNPMGAIKNAAFFLEMAVDDPDPDVQEALAIVNHQIERCEGIIRALLDFVRSRPPERREIGLNDVVQRALADVAVPPEVNLVTRLDPTVPPLSADSTQLHQIFTNLLHNAVQAMPEGGCMTVATCQTSDKGAPSEGEVAIAISDTGVGIPEEDLERVFEPLVTTKVTGIGLGLAITRTLVRGHGGRVEVESEVGAGSTFTVWLPVGAGERRSERAGGQRGRGQMSGRNSQGS